MAKSPVFAKLNVIQINGQPSQIETILIPFSKICAVKFYTCPDAPDGVTNFGIIDVIAGSQTDCYKVSNYQANWECQITPECEPCGECEKCVIIDADSGCEIIHNGCLVVADLFF